MGKHGGHFLHTLSTSPHRTEGNTSPFPSEPYPWGEGFAIPARLWGHRVLDRAMPMSTTRITQDLTHSGSLLLPTRHLLSHLSTLLSWLAGHSVSLPCFVPTSLRAQCSWSWLSGNQGRTRTSPRCHSAPSFLYSRGFPALTSVFPSVLEAAWDNDVFASLRPLQCRARGLSGILKERVGNGRTRAHWRTWSDS